MENNGFSNMGLKHELLAMIEAKGFKYPTPIQTEAIPWALAGEDIMGQAQTGTGKTAAFGLPILNKVEKGQGLQALILCPTRELAVQITKEISFLGSQLSINVLPVYGGQSIEKQIYALKQNPEIVVGTPGRLLDHLQRRTISLKEIKFLVLDEADEMLDMGFLPDIEKIIGFCPLRRQTFLFSATLDEKVRRLAAKYMHKPRLIVIPSPERTVPVIEQKYYVVKPGWKNEFLCWLLESLDISSSLIFCRTKRGAAELAAVLQSRGYTADCLHGDMSQRERDHVMNAFRRRRIRILTATDLAARGLDIKHVSHVINYDIPEDPENYVHRIGRTGRAGRRGTAITLVEPEQMKWLKAIERYIGRKIEKEHLPLDEKVREKQLLQLEALVQNKVKEKISPLVEELALRLMKNNQPEDLLKTVLSMLWKDYYGETEEGREDFAEMVNIALPWGRKHGINVKLIHEFIMDYTGLSSSSIGEIEIGKEETYVEIPLDYVDIVYKAIDSFPVGRRTGKRTAKTE
ncbi:ATP-dependent RNA helicase DeaD [Thermosyntropha lipolytica DSM 11003]|uniref:ATP-dependent RNA helicase CshA n=1 Tax=Thermosyntropha lipolytica DSM 11003 TaxID=1123382 RepID=A0A1M5JH62_9FIRM|nr:DEAD/DEAH box helicase [Thermosyntropha lipolytica]SHG39936.1 ATP-dependent RNA helicase DeaD [Thermosyntropha lipolytica DSM 11003]